METLSVYQGGIFCVVDDGKSLTGRKPRADAQRNRALLLKTAKAAFAEKGAAASLDEIARTAGVGAGTLYRHETEQLVTAASRLAETQAPIAALREWLHLFVDYMATKHGMYDALNSIVGGPSELYSASAEQMTRALAKLIDRA